MHSQKPDQLDFSSSSLQEGNGSPTQSQPPSNEHQTPRWPAGILSFVKRIQERIGKKGLIAGLVLVLSISTLYIVGAVTAQDPHTLVKEFETAVYEGNTEKLTKMLVSNDSKVKIDAESMKKLMAIMKKEPKYQSIVTSSLRSAADLYTNKIQGTDDFVEEYDKVSDGSEGYRGDIYLHRNEIPFFYDTYEIRIHPYQVAITTNEPNTKIIFNGKEVFQTNSKQLTHVETVLPGVHHVKTAKSYDFWELTNDKEVAAINEPTGKVEVSLESKGETVSLSSLFPQTKLVINGKDTTKLVTDYEKFGPVAKQSGMTVLGETEMPWGIEKSYEREFQTGTEKYDLTPQTLSTKEARTQVTELINTHVKQRLRSMVEGNPAVFTQISDTLRKDLVEDIQFSKSSHEYSGRVQDCKIDYHQVDYLPTTNPNIILFTIPIIEHRTITDKKSFFSKDAQEEFNEKLVSIQYNKTTKKWLISNLVDDRKWERNRGDDYMNNPDVVKTEFK
ncbi:hypothetical protein [Thermoactinomyces sp. DSM 45892]|uniref:TcaA 3rd/4th domain-containing protein n=1 Tax=Thermoactinomyces sp. DSM 45892 TaxID=1882753 RepID=UPI00089D2B50|nr:hypothetical protein [Thermoactinomyces sp. DSM 45892]SDY83936.1 hypothetical protein SAMN05444416_10940 [Thermoactinomyces sp. DSM 45892]